MSPPSECLRRCGPRSWSVAPAEPLRREVRGPGGRKTEARTPLLGGDSQPTPRTAPAPTGLPVPMDVPVLCVSHGCGHGRRDLLRLASVAEHQVIAEALGITGKVGRAGSRGWRGSSERLCARMGS